MPETVISEPKSGKTIRVIDLVYREDADGSWPVRIYMPERQGPLPALLDVHGGAWNVGDHTDNELIDRHLAASGLVVFAIGFRKAPRHAYPAQVADVNYATRWIKAHADEFNAHAEGMGGLGASSGGHSLLLSAMRPDDVRYHEFSLPGEKVPDARLSYLIALWPVLDPYGRYLFAKEKNRDFLIEATDAYFLGQEAMQEGSPLLALERGELLDLPQALIVQGSADGNVPLDAVSRFVDVYRAAGGVIELAWFPEMPHGFALKPGTETDHALKVMADFILRQQNRPIDS